MKKIALAAATAAAIFTAAPLFVGAIPAKAENLKMAQANLDVQIGRDRDEKAVRDRDEKAGRDGRDKDSGITVGVGPKGLVVGPKQNCRTVTTTVETDNGRKEKRTERRCD